MLLCLLALYSRCTKNTWVMSTGLTRTSRSAASVSGAASSGTTVTFFFGCSPQWHLTTSLFSFACCTWMLRTSSTNTNRVRSVGNTGSRTSSGALWSWGGWTWWMSNAGTKRRGRCTPVFGVAFGKEYGARCAFTVIRPAVRPLRPPPRLHQLWSAVDVLQKENVAVVEATTSRWHRKLTPSRPHLGVNNVCRKNVLRRLGFNHPHHLFPARSVARGRSRTAPPCSLVQNDTLWSTLWRWTYGRVCRDDVPVATRVLHQRRPTPSPDVRCSWAMVNQSPAQILRVMCVKCVSVSIVILMSTPPTSIRVPNPVQSYTTLFLCNNIVRNIV